MVSMARWTTSSCSRAVSLVIVQHQGRPRRSGGPFPLGLKDPFFALAAPGGGGATRHVGEEIEQGVGRDVHQAKLPDAGRINDDRAARQFVAPRAGGGVAALFVEGADI